MILSIDTLNGKSPMKKPPLTVSIRTYVDIDTPANREREQSGNKYTQEEARMRERQHTQRAGRQAGNPPGSQPSQ